MTSPRPPHRPQPPLYARTVIVGIRLIVEVLDYAPDSLTPREGRALVALAENANDDTRRTWDSIESPKILHRARLSRSQMYVVIGQLIAKKALERVQAGQKNGTAKYRIPHLDTGLCPWNRDTDPLQCPETRDADEPLSVPESGTLTDSQSPGSRDTDDSQCPGFRDVSVPVSGTPTPPPSERDISSAAPAPADPAAPDPFDAFWSEYPRKVSKGAARRAFTAALKRGASPADITAAATTHRAHWKRTGRKPEFVPYPATWLNSESYDDDLTTSQAAPPAAAIPTRWADPADRGIF